MAGKRFDVVEVVTEVRIDAPPERVWEALTEEPTAWWQRDFYTRKEPRGFRIEARPGGRVYEDCGDGEGFVWFFVTGVERNRCLQLAGDSDERWGGPARHLTRFELTPGSGGTTVRLVEQVYGFVDKAKLQESLESGWKLLLADCFKPWVETGRHPERPASVA